ncbi:MAG: radical SAM protein [Firmicutes bacterium]|nr:radical SAM protein [Bacillota bacterium]
MKIGLIDVDSHHFPNLCLMKLSAYHKTKGDTVEWWNGFEKYDIVYKSKVFTEVYTTEENTVIYADKVMEGGTGYDLKNKLPYEIEHCYPDYSLYPKLTKDTAYGFLTRGCPRCCSFCIVSQKEGKQSVKVANLSEFWRGQKTIKLLDPNLLACKDHIELLQQLIDSKAYVDFTQGIDARCINKQNAELLSKIKVKMIHFAFDDMKQEKNIVKGLKLYKRISNIPEYKTGIYILTNFNTTHEQDLYRVKVVQELGYRPYIMIYNKKSATKITKDLQRWANNRMIYYASDQKWENYNSITKTK